jgi:hypothetical protein
MAPVASYEDFDTALLAASERDAPAPRAPRRARACFALAVGSTLLVALVAVVAVTSLSLAATSDTAGAPPRLGEADADARTFDESGRFIMRHFDRMRPMSSFLPGVAGLWGLPMWVFYVNRGQAVATFGIENKDGGILMFQTAEKAYQSTSSLGFRTIIKGSRDGAVFTAQPFDVAPNSPRRDMFIGSNEVEIEEVDERTGLQTNVLYFTVPNEDFSAMVRRVTLTNVANTSVEVEMIDGLARLEPYGLTIGQLQSMGRTMEGWMHVYNYEESMTAPFFHLVTSPADTADVKLIKRGHFAIAFVEDSDNVGDDGHELLPIICDQQAIFGLDTTLQVPGKFFASSLEHVLATPQSTTSRTPSAFAGAAFSIAPGASASVSIIYGHAADLPTFLKEILPKLRQAGYVSAARAGAQALTAMMTSRVSMSSGQPLMDEYVKQNYLDNSLRGGMPFVLGATAGHKPKIYHAFSRIHGDLERDYNNFVIETSYFSQGPGNFRDVNQNRRCDVLQLPAVHDFNVRQFLTYVQADGYNQLTVATAFFKIKDQAEVLTVASRLVAPGPGYDLVSGILSKPFRPGQLFNELKASGIELMLPREELLDLVTAAAEQVPAGSYAHGQGGFWTDHWTYNLDLLHNFVAVYPDEKQHMLYDSEPVPFFLSLGRVLPRSAKYVLADNAGTVRQYDAVVEPEDKGEALKAIWTDPAYVGDQYAGAMWQRDARGDVFRVPIIAKLVVLVTCKFAILDPLGMGVEMEAGKPGWNDAMNGLPGLFGSEMPAAYELHELLDWTATAIDEAKRAVALPEELSALLDAIDEQLGDYAAGDVDDFGYWDGVRTALETYREATAITFSGEMVIWPAGKIGKANGVLGRMLRKQEQGIERALTYAPDKHHRVSPTYFRFTVRALAWLRAPCRAAAFMRASRGPVPACVRLVALARRCARPRALTAVPLSRALAPPAQVTKFELVGTSSSRGLPTVRVQAFEPEVLPLFLEGPVRHMKTLKHARHEEKTAVYQAVKDSALRDTKLDMYKISESLEGQPFEVGRMMAFNAGWLENESIWMHMSYKWYLEVSTAAAARRASTRSAARRLACLPACSRAGCLAPLCPPPSRRPARAAAARRPVRRVLRGDPAGRRLLHGPGALRPLAARGCVLHRVERLPGQVGARLGLPRAPLGHDRRVPEHVERDDDGHAALCARQGRRAHAPAHAGHRRLDVEGGRHARLEVPRPDPRHLRQRGQDAHVGPDRRRDLGLRALHGRREGGAGRHVRRRGAAGALRGRRARVQVLVD